MVLSFFISSDPPLSTQVKLDLLLTCLPSLTREEADAGYNKRSITIHRELAFGSRRGTRYAHHMDREIEKQLQQIHPLIHSFSPQYLLDYDGLPPQK